MMSQSNFFFQVHAALHPQGEKSRLQGQIGVRGSPTQQRPQHGTSPPNLHPGRRKLPAEQRRFAQGDFPQTGSEVEDRQVEDGVREYRGVHDA